MNISEGKGEQPAEWYGWLRRLVVRRRNIPEEPHARVHLSGVVEDPKKLLGGGDTPHLRKQRIDLAGNLGACIGIDARPEGVNVHAVISFA